MGFDLEDGFVCVCPSVFSPVLIFTGVMLVRIFMCTGLVTFGVTSRITCVLVFMALLFYWCIIRCST